ncbi:MAG: metal-dependent hydrolase [Zoogloeaceae bacterium]|jgi:inner membrane protein|nr:metal-dependent hydrolase [Zoogloeaceae bacterium]
MPTIFTHPAPMLALSLACGTRVIPPRLVVALLLFAMLPDLDGIGFYRGVPYGSWLGHRGFSHSLLFALTCGLSGFGVAPWLKASRRLTGGLIFLAALSHIALDALTNGGLGVALLWPFTDTRYFFPWRPIQVSPMSLARLFSERGLAVLYSELSWIWLPAFATALFVRHLRRRREQIKGNA